MEAKKRQVGRMIFMATNLDVEPLLKAKDDRKKMHLNGIDSMRGEHYPINMPLPAKFD